MSLHEIAESWPAIGNFEQWRCPDSGLLPGRPGDGARGGDAHRRAGRDAGPQPRADGHVGALLLGRRVGGFDQAMEEQMRQLSLAELEDLSEALLNFSQVSDVIVWLQAHHAR